MSESSSPRRSYWQFSVRTLLFVTLCVAGTIAGFRFGYYRGQDERRLQSLVTKVYDLTDVAPLDSVSGRHDLDAVTDMVTSTIDPNNWSSVGGSGSIVAFTPSPPTLVIHQSVANHEAIASLFDDLRKTQNSSESRQRRGGISVRR